MKSFLLLALSMGFVAIATASSQETPLCTWGGLGFNPYERWNVFSFNDIGSAAVPYGSDFQGRGAALGNIWVHQFTWNLLGDNTYPFAATAGGSFWQEGGDAMNGGIQASGLGYLRSMHIQGDVVSTDNTLDYGGVSSGQSVTASGGAFAKVFFNFGTGSSAAGGKHIQSGLSLNIAPGKTLNDVKAFFIDQSNDYAAMANTVAGATYIGATNGDLIIPVVAGMNVLNVPDASHSITPATLKNAARLLIKGPLSAKLIINVAGASFDLDTLEIFEATGPANVWSARPSFGRLLLNFNQATALTMISPSYFSVLAPNANMNYNSGVMWGNLIVNNLFDPDGYNGQVNLLNWQPECPDAPIPPTPPSPGDTGTIPSPPEECPRCPWDAALGFNPWQIYNVFSLGNIGSSESPCGADYQGRVGAVGSGWFKSFSLHDVNQGSPPYFSGSFGGDFSLKGGSIKNGGIETGRDFYAESADIRGSVVAIGDAVVGVLNKAVTVFGSVSAGGDITYPTLQSKATGGFFDHASPLSITAPLNDIAAFFLQQSQDYANMADTISQGNGVTFTPGPINPNTITATLAAGINVMTLTAAQLQKASKLNLKGDPTGVLIINVLTSGDFTFDSLDVYEGPPYVLGTSFGRVLVNMPNAGTITVPWGSGHWSLLAPTASVNYISGVWSGNWVVGNLSCSANGGGGGQINVHPWNPPCPECPDPISYIMCEGGEAMLECDEGLVISVTSAIYGRTDGTTCPHTDMADTACVKDVTSLVGTFCNGFPFCSFTANNAILGPDPCLGTYKYLNAQYLCLPASSVPSRRKFSAQAMSRYSVESLTGFLTQKTSVNVPRWIFAVGAAVAGVALSALVVAMMTMRKMAHMHMEYQKLSKKRAAMPTPTTPPHAVMMSPSMSHRGGKLAASP